MKSICNRFGALLVVASCLFIPGTAMGQASWYTVLEQAPNPAVVTDSALRLKIVDSGFPWRVQDIETGIEMMLIPAGTFQMGASLDDSEAIVADETPAHQVTLTQAFYLGKTEVTEGQYGGGTSTLPRNLSWNNAQAFCTAKGLRLPTSAEWEFACRAGTTTPRYGVSNDIAWNLTNSDQVLHSVATKLPNALGLYDMLGNLNEFCSGWWDTYTQESVIDPQGPTSGTYHVLRGGSFLDTLANNRASTRGGANSWQLERHLGFRVARTASFFWSISGVLPVSGPSTGGTAIRINGTSGTNFPISPVVTIGGVAATDIVRVTPSLITAVTPAGIPGMAVVTVNSASSESFYYRPSCDGDLDNNGTIDSSDLGLMLVNYGNCYESLATPQQQEPFILQSVETPSPLLLNKK